MTYWNSFLFVCYGGAVRREGWKLRNEHGDKDFVCLFACFLSVSFVCLFHAVKPPGRRPDCLKLHSSQKLLIDCGVL